MRRPRVTEGFVASLADELSERDLAVVQTLDRVRVASRGQLMRLHFDGGEPHASHSRVAQRTLRRLTDKRVLTVLERKVGGVIGGSAQTVYALDVAGQRLASACGPAGGARLRRPWTPGLPFLRHAVLVTELYTRIREQERAEQTTLVTFDAEPACWRVFTGSGGARVTLKPDAFVRCVCGGYEHASFVEVDRATASVPTLGRKLNLYRRYFQTGREQERFGLFPRVVVLVPHEARRDAIAEVIHELSPESRELFRLSMYDDGLGLLTGEAA